MAVEPARLKMGCKNPRPRRRGVAMDAGEEALLTQHAVAVGEPAQCARTAVEPALDHQRRITPGNSRLCRDNSRMRSSIERSVDRYSRRVRRRSVPCWSRSRSGTSGTIRRTLDRITYPLRPLALRPCKGESQFVNIRVYRLNRPHVPRAALVCEFDRPRRRLTVKRPSITIARR